MLAGGDADEPLISSCVKGEATNEDAHSLDVSGELGFDCDGDDEEDDADDESH